MTALERLKVKIDNLKKNYKIAEKENEELKIELSKGNSNFQGTAELKNEIRKLKAEIVKLEQEIEEKDIEIESILENVEALLD